MLKWNLKLDGPTENLSKKSVVLHSDSDRRKTTGGGMACGLRDGIISNEYSDSREKIKKK
jgi:hypothetical protein